MPKYYRKKHFALQQFSNIFHLTGWSHKFTTFKGFKGNFRGNFRFSGAVLDNFTQSKGCNADD